MNEISYCGITIVVLNSVKNYIRLKYVNVYCIKLNCS